jgi:hypothetical protein
MKKSLIILILAVLFGSPLQAGVVFEVETKDHKYSPARVDQVQMFMEGRNLKIGTAAGSHDSQTTMIYRGEHGEMLMIDHDEKSYSVMDKETIKAMAGQMKQASSQLEEALKNVPEDQRAMMEQMMKQNMPVQQAPHRSPTELLQKTGDRDTIHGYPCLKYNVLRDGTKISELWVTNWDNIEGGREAAEVFEEMADFFKEMMESFSSARGAPGGRSDDFGGSVFQHMKELDGFPVVTKEFEDDGSLEGESALRSSRRRRLDPATFEPPVGYKRQ